jgi:hypothetical protein
VGGDPDQVHPAAVYLDDEQQVQPAQPDGVHREEVRRLRSGRLCTQELHPACTARPRRRTQPVPAQEPPDRCRGDLQRELAALADDP